jgi:CHAT domain-containing protein/Tfp pilus assembly protein PilF
MCLRGEGRVSRLRVVFPCFSLLLVLLAVACGRRAALDPASIFRQATHLRERGDLPQALALADRGFGSFQNSPEWHWRFRLLKAEVLLTQGNPEALKLLREPLPRLPDSADLQSRLLLDQGLAEFSVSHYPESKRLFDQSLALAASHQLQPLMAEIEFRRGAARARLGDVAGSELDLLDALRLARALRDTYLEASVLGNLGFIRMTAGRYDEAVSWLEQSLGLLRTLQAKVATARALNNLGHCYTQLGQPERAAPLFEQAAQAAAETGDLTDRYLSLGRLAEEYQDKNDFPKANEFYEQAIDAARQAHSTYWTAKWLYTLADSLLAMGDLARAGDYNRRAIALEGQLGNPLETLLPQINAARIAEARQQPAEAERIYHSVIVAAQKLQDTEAPSVLLEARSRLANLLVRAHRDREADTQFQVALALLNAQRSGLIHYQYKISYLSSLVKSYQDYVDFLMAQHREADALRVAESSRARVLAEMLGRQSHGGSSVHSYDYRILARASHSILLSYWLAPDRSFLWVITPNKVTTLQLPPKARIEALVNAYAGAIEGLHDPLREGSDAGRELYETLVPPAVPLIPPHSNVAVVLDGALHNLDFETLPAGGRKPHYWIEDVTLSVVPSLDLLYQNLGQQSRQMSSLLLIGDPLPPDPKSYPKLINATQEISGIKSQFREAVVRTGADAAPAAYFDAGASRFSVIHFAAHAEANHNDPLDSAIILSPHGDDYKLYARDVVGLPIHANLVTLSACRGAGSRTYAGEGLVGFAWAFLEAGAQNVVAGLWEVDDASTAKLMEHLYAEVRNGASPQQALRAAKLAMLHSEGPYRKPYYWAPFQVITDSLGGRP